MLHHYTGDDPCWTAQGAVATQPSSAPYIGNLCLFAVNHSDRKVKSSKFSQNKIFTNRGKVKKSAPNNIENVRKNSFLFTFLMAFWPYMMVKYTIALYNTVIVMGNVSFISSHSTFAAKK